MVLASHSDTLSTQRRVELEVNFFEANLLSRGLDGLPDGEEDGGGQEERRLTDALRGVNGLWVGRATQQGHVELVGDVAKGRNFVSAWCQC